MQKSIAAVGVVALLVSGCATIVAPGPDLVPISSKPPGAMVYVDGVPVGVTPVTVPLKRSGSSRIRIELEGYQPVFVTQDKVFNGWFLGNILIGGLIGIIVDVATSNVTKHSTDPVMVVLRPIERDGQLGEPVVLHAMPTS